MKHLVHTVKPFIRYQSVLENIVVQEKQRMKKLSWEERNTPTWAEGFQEAVREKDRIIRLVTKLGITSDKEEKVNKVE